jgi:uncharacterized protein DUF929
MVDWDLVERRRSKGWDWDRIAEDPRVDFHADESAGDPGRALRALYYQRRSKGKRKPSTDGGSQTDLEPEKRWTLERVMAILVPLFGLWTLLAYVIPSPVGTYVPAVPDLILLFLASVFILAYALLRATERWNVTIRNAVILGCVLGLVVSGGLGITAVVNGCPTLTNSSSGEPQNWTHVANAQWAENGAPVFFFYGSAACPYCSASSWAFVVALEAFGTLSGTYYDRSNPTDVYPNTPETVLANAVYQSRYITLEVAESTDDNQILAAPTTGCVQSAYVSAYDSGGSIPYVVVGGTYYHIGVMVNPAQLQGLNAQQVQGQVNNQSGTAWNAISPIAYALEAFFLKCDGGQPSSVASNPAVKAILDQIH